MAKNKKKIVKKKVETKPKFPKNEFITSFDTNWPDWNQREPQLILQQLQLWKEKWLKDLEKNPNIKLQEAINIMDDRIKQIQEKVEKSTQENKDKEKQKYEQEIRKNF